MKSVLLIPVALGILACAWATSANGTSTGKTKIARSNSELSVSELASFLGISTSSYSVQAKAGSHLVFSIQVWRGGALKPTVPLGWLEVQKGTANHCSIIEKLSEDALQLKVCLDSRSFTSLISKLRDEANLRARANWKAQDITLDENSEIPLQATFLNEAQISGLPDSAKPQDVLKAATKYDEAIVILVKAANSEGTPKQ